MAGNSKNVVVVDSSFVLSVLMPDENSEVGDAVFKKLRAASLVVASSELLPFEVLNGIKLAIIRKRITRSIGSQLAHNFLEMPIILEKVDWLSCWRLAWRNSLTIYDAAFLFVSRTNKCRLFSLDSHLLPFSQKHSRSAVKNGK